MYELIESNEFSTWLKSLVDQKTIKIIARRLERAANGHFGDHHKTDGPVWEMRIDHGPGYRIYYAIAQGMVCVILAGGTKKGQNRDIERAEKILTIYRDAQS